MTVEELDLLAKLNEIDPENIDDDEIALLLQEALNITDGDVYEAITFIAENSELDFERLEKVYTTFLK